MTRTRELNRKRTGGSRKPRSWQRFEAQYPDVAVSYDALSDACRNAGPLDARTLALAKLAISVGGSVNRTIHVHTKKALEAGVEPSALRQIAVIALPTVGLPRGARRVTVD